MRAIIQYAKLTVNEYNSKCEPKLLSSQTKKRRILYTFFLKESNKMQPERTHQATSNKTKAAYRNQVRSMEEEIVGDSLKEIDGRKAHHRHHHHRHHSGGKGNHNHNHSRASSSEALEDPFVRTFPNEEPNTLREDTLQTGKNNQPFLFNFHHDKPNLGLVACSFL
jgi:hypothetical protein